MSHAGECLSVSGVWLCPARLIVYFLLPETNGILLEQVSTLTHVLPSCWACLLAVLMSYIVSWETCIKILHATSTNYFFPTRKL